MSANLKRLSIAFAVLAAMGVLATSASGESFWFKSDAGAGAKTFLDGHAATETSDVFTTDTSNVTCTHITYTGESEYTGPTGTTLKVIPVYTGCKLGSINATVEMDGCYYVLHTHTYTSANKKYDVTSTIACPEKSAITVKVVIAGVLKCHIDIPAQTIATGVSVVPTTVAGRRILDVTVEIGTGITYTQTEGSGLGRCAAASDTTNGSYIGEEVFEGTSESGVATDIWVEGEAPSPPSFHSEAEDTTLIGETVEGEEFVFNAGTAECSEAVFKGTMAAKESSEVSLAPEYGSCSAFGFSTGEVKPNGCTYTLHSGKEEAGKYEGSADVACPEGKKMEVIARVLGLTKCTVTVGSQKGLTALTSTNQGSGKTRDLRFDIGLTGIAYTQDTGEGLGKCSSGSFENGKYNGAATVIGENAGKEQVGIWVE